MNVQIKRIDKSLPLPVYNPPGAAAVDLYSRIDIELSPHVISDIPTNIIVVTPPNYAFIVVPRSSTPKKKGLSIPHGIGIIDPYFSGPDDEIHMRFYNFTDEVVRVEKGERIGQGMFIKVDAIEWEEVEDTGLPTRGGFGSTG